MRKISTIFLQIVIILMSIGVITLLILVPLLEGRAANLDILSIYSDPFILYVYVASIPFFVALYNAFKLLVQVAQNKVFTSNAVQAVKNIKNCSILLAVFIVAAGLYILNFHHKDDDPASFLSMSIVLTFVCVIIATATAIFEKTLQSALNLKSENDLTI